MGKSINYESRYWHRKRRTRFNHFVVFSNLFDKIVYFFKGLLGRWVFGLGLEQSEARPRMFFQVDGGDGI